METLHIALISTNTFSTPPTPGYGGEVAIYHLAKSLDELGHSVNLYATPGSYEPPHGRLFFQRFSYNKWPEFILHEKEIYPMYRKDLLAVDVIHDFSHSGATVESAYHQDARTNFVKTLLGGVYNNYNPAMNAIVWSQSWRERALRGATDYEGTEWEKLGGYTGRLKDCHVVYGGTDTDFYVPGDERGEEFLWFTRWHPSKGYHVAIELAKRTGIPLVLTGDHPDDAVSPDHRQGALHAMELAKGADNIRFEWLPKEGHHERKRELLQRAKALLYPVQFQEPFGLVMIEALSCGTPIIGTNLGAVPEVVGSSGIVVPNMLNDLAVAVQDIGKIRPEDCRRDAVERFDRRIMARAYVDEYRKVMNGEVWGL